MSWINMLVFQIEFSVKKQVILGICMAVAWFSLHEKQQ